MSIGEQLRKARISKKLKLKDVAAASNLSISYISDIEHNKSTPPLETLKNLCKALDLSLYDVFLELDTMLVKEKSSTRELYALLEDFDEWDERDKDELISYLKVKKSARDEKNRD